MWEYYPSGCGGVFGLAAALTYRLKIKREIRFQFKVASKMPAAAERERRSDDAAGTRILQARPVLHITEEKIYPKAARCRLQRYRVKCRTEGEKI